MGRDALKAELTDDPLGRGYSAMTDSEASASLRAVNRTRNRLNMTSSEVLNAVDLTEWIALTDANRRTVWDVVHLGTINPFGVEKDLLVGVFGAGSVTITALAAARHDDVSRGEELGLGVVYPGHVEQARAM